MTDPEDTPPETLMRAAAIGRDAGLRYVYAGNIPGHTGDLEHTRCAVCNETLIHRYGYRILDYRLTPDACCPNCAAPLPGRWATAFRPQRIDRPYLPEHLVALR